MINLPDNNDQTLVAVDATNDKVDDENLISK